MTGILATCCPGLESVLRQEVEELVGNGVQAQAGRGAVRFFAEETKSAFRLGCADNLYALIGQTQAPANRLGFPEFKKNLAALPIALTLESLGMEWSGKSFHVSASRSGPHSYSRFEAADAALEEICRVLGVEKGTSTQSDVAFRLEIKDQAAELSVKLTGADFRFRGLRQFSTAAIRPTIARALVRLAGLKPDDVFLDPFCGSGTILSERLAFPARAVIGGDINSQALRSSEENLAGRAELHPWNALELPLEAASVSAIVTNPPWGNQIAVEDEDALYTGFLREAKRVLGPGGRLVALTDRQRAMENACQAAGLPMRQILTISLHGSLCEVWYYSGH